MEFDRIEYEWRPMIRVILKAPDGTEYEFPTSGKWIALNMKEMSDFLDKAQCKALWQWLGRSDKPPKKLTILLNSEDVMRCFPGKH